MEIAGTRGNSGVELAGASVFTGILGFIGPGPGGLIIPGMPLGLTACPGAPLPGIMPGLPIGVEPVAVDGFALSVALPFRNS